jgi:hypothetical protein
MENVISIEKLKEERNKKKLEIQRTKDKRRIDISASYASIENCLKYIEMNKLKELDNLKASMKQTLKNLAKASLE